MRAKAMREEPTPDGSLAPIHDGWRRRIDVLRIRETGNRAKAGNQLACTGRLGGLETALRQAESEVELARIYVERGEEARDSACLGVTGS